MPDISEKFVVKIYDRLVGRNCWLSASMYAVRWNLETN